LQTRPQRVGTSLSGACKSYRIDLAQSDDPSRDMKDSAIARAIARLESAGVPVANEFHVLNHGR